MWSIRSGSLTDAARDIVDWVYFEKSRTELGPGFIRILTYLKEDGAKSVTRIEQAMREENTAQLVLPAHTLKGESRQLGAEPLAKVAELIETTARFCVENRRFPDELVPVTRLALAHDGDLAEAQRQSRLSRSEFYRRLREIRYRLVCAGIIRKRFGSDGTSIGASRDAAEPNDLLGKTKASIATKRVRPV